eukprot:COSAG01_NODE_5614_length_4144_cov_49.752040_1_plen_106_part_00
MVGYIFIYVPHTPCPLYPVLGVIGLTQLNCWVLLGRPVWGIGPKRTQTDPTHGSGCWLLTAGLQGHEAGILRQQRFWLSVLLCCCRQRQLPLTEGEIQSMYLGTS